MNSEQFKEAQGLVQAGFFDLEEVSNGTVTQTPLDFEATVAQVKSLIEEDNALGRQQEEIAARRYEIRVQIGFSLIALQQEHAKRGYGDFIAFAEKEFGYKSRNTVYDHMHVAERLGNLNVLHGGHSNWKTAIELARPSTSDTIIEQVLEGSIEANPEAIKQARKDEAEAKQRAKQLQNELEAEKRERETNDQAHAILVQVLEQQLEEKPEPERVIEYQDTLETAAKVATLEQQIKALEDKPNIPLETEQELDRLKANLKNAKDELSFYTTQNAALAERNKQLTEESNRSLVDHIAAVGRLRIRQEWQAATSVLQASHSQFHTKIPSKIDRESFEGEEYTRTAQTIEVLEQTIALLKQLMPHSSTLEEANITDAESFPTPALIEAKKPVIGIPPEYQALFAKYEQAVLDLDEYDLLVWSATDYGYTDQMMKPEKHIQFTKELLSTEVDRRVNAAIEAMRTTLVSWEE